MSKIFNEQDREEVFNYILQITKNCSKVTALCQVGSGAIGYHDARSDLDFVIALESDDCMLEVMEYMNQKIKEKYEVLFFSQAESRQLQCYVLSNLLEIDLGYGYYEHAAAWKPAFKVLFDNSGVVEEKMIKSREWMDDNIFGDKQKKDIELACSTAWAHMMHAAVAINRNNTLRAIGEIEALRKMYIDLLGNRYRLESGMNREMDKLPDEGKNAVKSTFLFGDRRDELWRSLLRLTELLYKELEGCNISISKEMMFNYYEDLK